MTWTNKSKWTNGTPSGGAREGYSKNGVQGNRVDPTAYQAYYGHLGISTPRLPNGAYQPDPNVPTLLFVSRVTGVSVPFPAARNKAWDKLVNNMRSGPANLGTTIAEWNESLGMITKRASQLYRGYRHLRRGNFRDFLREFNIGPKRKHKNMRRNPVNQASSLWLEYSFGWKPLTKDIYDAAQAISQPVPGGRFSGSGRETFRSSASDEYDTNQMGQSWNTDGVCKMGAFVTVVDPNAYLAQQMGVANPLLIAWEVVPFSFMVDWVFDVGTFLGALTDFLGCEISKAYTLYYAKGFVKTSWKYNFDPVTTRVVSGQVAVYKRRTGLDFPTPNFSFQANIGQSLTRAANAVSLLGQILTKRT